MKKFNLLFTIAVFGLLFATSCTEELVETIDQANYDETISNSDAEHSISIVFNEEVSGLTDEELFAKYNSSQRAKNWNLREIF